MFCSSLQPNRGMFGVDNCLWRLVVYTEHDFHLNLGFKLSSQTLVFTLNRVSQTVVFILNQISKKIVSSLNIPLFHKNHTFFKSLQSNISMCSPLPPSMSCKYVASNYSQTHVTKFLSQTADMLTCQDSFQDTCFW